MIDKQCRNLESCGIVCYEWVAFNELVFSILRKHKTKENEFGGFMKKMLLVSEKNCKFVGYNKNEYFTLIKR